MEKNMFKKEGKSWVSGPPCEGNPQKAPLITAVKCQRVTWRNVLHGRDEPGAVCSKLDSNPQGGEELNNLFSRFRSRAGEV